MSFPRTYDELLADTYELEYVETEGGDVFASALVAPSGEIVKVVDDDGAELRLSRAERARVDEMVRQRREAEVR